MGKKPFLDKKASKHYHVVHRSQKDPLINDSEAPDRVLQEVLPLNQLKVNTCHKLKKRNTNPLDRTRPKKKSTE